VLVAYFLSPLRWRNLVLFAVSLVFYGWGEPAYVFLMVATILIDYVAGYLIGRSSVSQKYRKTVLVLAVVINLGILFVFKYLGFIVDSLRLLPFLSELPRVQLALPIGISFYTFQALSYVVDVYRNEVKAQKNFFWLLLYSSLFYQCIAGPIVRYSDVQREITERKTSFNDVSEGITRFTVGLGKKALLANTCGSLSDNLLVADSLIASSPDIALTELSSRSVAGIFFGVLFYMLQIYLDFSAYSDMAIGMGRMVGFHFKENFLYPYTAKSVTDFWRRWHISLSTFFRDYVYIPLGGNRKGKFNTYRNLLIVWFLTGLWHGASWNFILWGLFFFVFLVIEKLGFSKLLDKIPSFFSHAYLLVVVYFGWILFRFSDFRFIPVVLKGLFGLNGNPLIDFETRTLLISNVIFIIVALFSVTPFVKRIATKAKDSESMSFGRFIYAVTNILAPIALLLLSTLTLIGDSYNPFLYFQF
jgi:alginate O-acetyltransferase complex protein AlgI